MAVWWPAAFINVIVGVGVRVICFYDIFNAHIVKVRSTTVNTTNFQSLAHVFVMPAVFSL